jgi:hypothetical protein
MKQIPLFGSETKGLSQFLSSQRRVNCYYELIPSGEKDANVVIRGTPGYFQFTQLPSTPIKGGIVVNQTLYVVAGMSLYSVNQAGVSTLLGVMSNITNNIVALASNGLQILISTGSLGYTYTIATNTLAQITSGGYPQSTASNCFLNGFFIVNNPGTSQFYISDVYDGTTWEALQFASAEVIPDNLLAVSALHNNLILWGANHIEFWTDTGGAPFPFSQQVGTAQNYGLAAVNSIAQFNNTMCFLGENVQGQVQVMMLAGYTPHPISDNGINHIINDFAITSDAIAFGYMVDGHPMYQITFPTAQRSFLYEGTNGLWSEVQSGVADTGRHNANLCIPYNGQVYITDTSSGNLYQFDTDVYTDNGATIKREIDTRHVSQDGNRFTIGELWFDFQLGQGLQTGQGSNPQIMLQTSRDNGETFGNERWAPIGKVGQYLGPRCVFRRLGQARDFVFRIRLTDPVPFVLIRGSAVLQPSTET